MVGITLSPEQIRTAPPEVRQWLEHEIAASLGLRAGSGVAVANPPHLVACTPQEAMTVYAAIRGMLPVVNVFFELGREGESIGQEGVEAFRLVDMQRHARLPGMQQVSACLEVIDQAFRQIRNDAGATLYAIDPKGYCVIATETQYAITAVWNEVVSSQQLPMAGNPSGNEAAVSRPAPFPFVETSGTVPPTSIHLDGLAPAATASGAVANVQPDGQAA